MKKAIELDALGVPTGRINFTFDDGVAGYTFDCAVLSAENRTYAVPFAMSHRLGDCAAGRKTEAERRAAIVELAAHYTDGAVKWNTRVGSSATAKSDNAAIEVLAELAGITVDEARAKFTAKKIAAASATGATVKSL